MPGEVFKVTNLTDHFVGDKVRGSQGLKWPKQVYGVVALLGEEPRDGSKPLDVDAAMARLGWQRVSPSHKESCAAHPRWNAGPCNCADAKVVTDDKG